MTFHAPVRKPYGVAPSPYMAQGAGKGLWKGLAFIAPFQTKKGAGTSTLLDRFGHPLAGSNLVASPTLVWTGTPYGLGIDVSDGTDHRRLRQAAFAPVTTSDGAGGGDFTVIMLANPRSEARIACGLSQRLASGNLNQFQLSFNYNSTPDISAGSLFFGTYNAAWSTVAAAGMVDGNYHVFGGVRRSGTMTLWRDGVSVATGSPTLHNIYSASADFSIGGVAHDTGFGMSPGDSVVFVAAWNRALTNFEMLLLGIDPFIMFRPAPRRKIINTVAAGTAVPVFMHHYMQQRAA